MKVAEIKSRYPERSKVASREELMSTYLPQVKRIVNRMAIHLPSSVDVEDLYHVGVIGLIQAIDRYDPDMENKFITYATHRIRGAVLSELRSRDYLSRTNRRKIRELDQVYAALEQKKGREVEDQELADAMGINLDELGEIKKFSSISFISFEEVGFSEARDKGRLLKLLVDGQSDALALTAFRQLKEALGRAIEQLPEKEKLVLSLYYYEELNMKETGKVLNITESRVSQIHSQAILRLRQRLRKEKIIES